MYYREHHCLPKDGQGGHRGGSSLLDNDAVYKACEEWLELQSKEGNHIAVMRFFKAVNEVLLPSLEIELSESEKKVSTKGCQRWLGKLGYTGIGLKKGKYIS